MNSPTAASQRGFRHELFLHHSAAELVEFVVPMVRDGVAADEPTLLLVRPDTAEAVQHLVGPSPYLTIQPALTGPGRPALHARAARQTLAGYARVVHQEPVIPPGQWPEWRRLEAVLNIVLRPHDTWAVCAYDKRTLTDEMIADLHATHPLIAHDHHHLRNDRYQCPVDFLEKHRESARPGGAHHPGGRARRTVPGRGPRHGGRGRPPSPAAHRSGRQPGLRYPRSRHQRAASRMATDRAAAVGPPARVTVTVTDTGPGPADPLVGLLPPDPTNGHAPANGPRPGPGPGLGLWLSHQLVDVAHRRHPDGYTIRLTATHPAEPSG